MLPPGGGLGRDGDWALASFMPKGRDLLGWWRLTKLRILTPGGGGWDLVGVTCGDQGRTGEEGGRGQGRAAHGRGTEAAAHR